MRTFTCISFRRHWRRGHHSCTVVSLPVCRHPASSHSVSLWSLFCIYTWNQTFLHIKISRSNAAILRLYPEQVGSLFPAQERDNTLRAEQVSFNKTFGFLPHHGFDIFPFPEDKHPVKVVFATRFNFFQRSPNIQPQGVLRPVHTGDQLEFVPSWVDELPYISMAIRFHSLGRMLIRLQCEQAFTLFSSEDVVHCERAWIESLRKLEISKKASPGTAPQGTPQQGKGEQWGSNRKNEVILKFAGFEEAFSSILAWPFRTRVLFFLLTAVSRETLLTLTPAKKAPSQESEGY